MQGEIKPRPSPDPPALFPDTVYEDPEQRKQQFNGYHDVHSAGKFIPVLSYFLLISTYRCVAIYNVGTRLMTVRAGLLYSNGIAC